MAGTEDRLASVGITRAPGESDENFADRAAQFLTTVRHGYGTREWWRALALAQSWWIRTAAVEGKDGDIHVCARGPLGLPLTRGVRRRLERKLGEEKPIGVRLVVR